MSEGLSPVRSAARLLAACGIVVLAACAQQPRAAAPVEAAPPPAAKPADQPPAAQPAAAPAQGAPAANTPGAKLPEFVFEPPDGKWLVDDQGRQYFLWEIPKVEGWYHWLNPEKTRVQAPYGLIFDVASYDEKSFQVKIYKTDNPAAPPPPQGPTAQEMEAVAATYRNGSGTSDRLVLEPFGNGLPDRGQWRNGFKVADMNGDGNPDVVHGPARKSLGGPVIFLGDGKGSWRRWPGLRFPPLAYDYGDVAVADFNGDGRPDLALAVHLHGLIALVSDGSGGFQEWGKGLDFVAPGKGEGGFSSRTLEAADWNGDGRPDLIALGEGPRMATAAAPGGAGPRPAPSTAYGVKVFLNQGDGTWVGRNESSQLFGEDLAVADFTNDGHLDMMLATSVLGEAEILRIGGAEAAGSGGVSGGGERGGWTKADLPGLRPDSYIGAVDVADLNRDGRPDLAVGYLSREAGVWRTGIDVFLSQAARAGGGWDRKGVAVVDGRPWVTALDSGDLDGDGKLDLAATTGEGEVWVFLGKGDGTFDREKTPEIAPRGECRGYDVHLVNLDADPADELVAEFAGEPSALFAPTQCLTEGGMGAWKARPASPGNNGPGN